MNGRHFRLRSARARRRAAVIRCITLWELDGRPDEAALLRVSVEQLEPF